MTAERDEEGSLGPHFAAARARRPVPDDRLIAAVLADAAAARHHGPLPVRTSARRSMPGALLPATGLAASLALGLWLGASGLAQLSEEAAWLEAAGSEAGWSEFEAWLFDPDAFLAAVEEG